MGFWDNDDDIDRPLDYDDMFDEVNDQRAAHPEAWERDEDIFKDHLTRYENEEYLFGEDDM